MENQQLRVNQCMALPSMPRNPHFGRLQVCKALDVRQLTAHIIYLNWTRMSSMPLQACSGGWSSMTAKPNPSMRIWVELLVSRTRIHHQFTKRLKRRLLLRLATVFRLDGVCDRLCSTMY